MLVTTGRADARCFYRLNLQDLRSSSRVRPIGRISHRRCLRDTTQESCGRPDGCKIAVHLYLQESDYSLKQ